jgi:hypothetical protein
LGSDLSWDRLSPKVSEMVVAVLYLKNKKELKNKRELKNIKKKEKHPTTQAYSRC